PSGYAEDQSYLSSAPVTADGNGNGHFDVQLLATTTRGEKMTATATDPSGNTSEFSAAMTSAGTGAHLQTDPCDPTKTALVVIGTDGNDQIVFSPVGNSGAVEVKLNGTSLGTFSPTGHLIAYGEGGDDDIQ